MAQTDFTGIATTAKLGSHPIHPMLIPFPIALLVATFACDLVFWATSNAFWAEAGFWTLTAAIVTALLAAIAGLADFLGNAQIRALSDAWQHMIGNLIAVLLAVVSLWMRYRYGTADAVLPWGILLSAVVVGMLLFTGWKGGDLVYHHRIGMHPEAPAQASAASRPIIRA
ncbi:DUF2231 domain-containing protein [Bradyrhizobium sp. 147]|uniref:DUF2231 domain-containing protein n=1 Tax=unclassified Bradyrhizobium TaxID=2631580 RepID=UPI001FF7BF2E|nr:MULTISPECIES: DUF2231 domain-containing protein [unclassified Bradyrhizobium]MCK1624922.1 DUF2231 domain-containing protein [Bradyrhizobium sp. 160]MCK1680926.1 DUF2231 domain-containing protein [Bradyrhizobium sp. 147]